MTKVAQVSDTTLLLYWELSQFQKISNKVGDQHDLNGSTYRCLAHGEELMLVASFTYSPKHSLIELNVSLQGRSAKRNPPRRIVATLEQQSRVMGQNEQGLWTSRPFSYSYRCHYPEGMNTLTKFLKRKQFRPQVPAFHILVEFYTPIVYGNAVESQEVDDQNVVPQEEIHVPETIQESELEAADPAQVTEIQFCTCSKPTVGPLQEAILKAQIGEQNVVVCGACGKVVARPFAEVGTEAVEEQAEQTVEEQVPDLETLMAEQPKTQVEVHAEPTKEDNQVHKKMHHKRGCVICERERQGLPEPETEKEVFTFNITDSFMLRKKIFK